MSKVCKLDPVKLWKDGEYSYPLAFGFEPDVVPYLHDDDKVRPAVLVVPGGGYAMAASCEAEPVAKKFFDYGYQTFVFTYTTNFLSEVPVGDQAVRDLSRCVRVLKNRRKEFRLDPGKIAIIGFSAGSHLTGSLAVHFDQLPDTDPALNEISPCPAAVLLCYPVITSGEYAHKGSFQSLLGKDIYEREDLEAKTLLQYNSLETQVRKDMPPVFMWQTVTDKDVPVENSMLMAEALQKAGVPFSYHLFPRGQHGLSLSDETIGRADYGDPHCLGQLFATEEAVKAGRLNLQEEEKQYLLDAAEFWRNPTPPVIEKEPAVWPDLARDFLAEVMA